MATHSWNPTALTRLLPLPTIVAEQHLKLAGPVQLKVLLWFAQHGTFDAEACAAAVGYPAADCTDAMGYWVSAGVIQTDTSAPVPPVSVPTATVMPVVTARPAAVKPTMKEVVATQKSSPQFAYLLNAVSARLGKPLPSGDMETLLYLFTTAGLPAEVILMVVEYAVQNNRFTMRYIEKVALDWADRGILSITAAEEHLCYLEHCNDAFFKLQTLCGDGKSVPSTAANMALAEKWVFQWHLPDELLVAACEQCLQKTGKLNIKYVDRVLTGWHDDGITGTDQLAVSAKNTAVTTEDTSDYEAMVETYVPKYVKKKKG